MANPISIKSRIFLETHDGSPRTRLLSLAYIFVALLYWAALYLYVPTLPVYLQTKTANLALVGTVLSMYGLWQAIVRFPVGISADALGRRKPFIVAGLALVGLGAWLMGSSGNIQGMMVGRAITGVAAGTWVPLLVLFGSQFKPKELLRATALLTAFGTLGRILGTGLTGFLNQLGGYPLAFFAATGCAALAALIMLALPEDPPAGPAGLARPAGGAGPHPAGPDACPAECRHPVRGFRGDLQLYPDPGPPGRGDRPDPELAAQQLHPGHAAGQPFRHVARPPHRRPAPAGRERGSHGPRGRRGGFRRLAAAHLPVPVLHLLLVRHRVSP